MFIHFSLINAKKPLVLLSSEELDAILRWYTHTHTRAVGSSPVVGWGSYVLGDEVCDVSGSVW